MRFVRCVNENRKKRYMFKNSVTYSAFVVLWEAYSVMHTSSGKRGTTTHNNGPYFVWLSIKTCTAARYRLRRPRNDCHIWQGVSISPVLAWRRQVSDDWSASVAASAALSTQNQNRGCPAGKCQCPSSVYTAQSHELSLLYTLNDQRAVIDNNHQLIAICI